jgi:hypothetical protein
VSFAAITLCVTSQRLFIVIVIVYFVIDSMRKLFDAPSHMTEMHAFMDLQMKFEGLHPRQKYFHR